MLEDDVEGDIDEKTVRPVGGIIFGPDARMPSWSGLVRGEETTSKLLDHSLYLADQHNFMGCAPSKTIARLLGQKLGNRWRRTLMLCARNISFTPTVTLDVDTSGFTLALDSLAEYTRKLSSGPLFVYRPAPMKKIQGLKVNPTAPFYEQVSVPPRHPIFKFGVEAPIMKCFECPLRMYKYPTSASASTAHQPGASTPSEQSDRDLTDFLIHIDPTAADFGTIPPPFWKAGASVLVVDTGYEPCVEASVPKSFGRFIKTSAQPDLISGKGTPEQRLDRVKWQIGRIVETAKRDDW